MLFIITNYNIFLVSKLIKKLIFINVLNFNLINIFMYTSNIFYVTDIVSKFFEFLTVKDQGVIFKICKRYSDCELLKQKL